MPMASQETDHPDPAASALAYKLKAYGEPYPLKVNGEYVAWLVPDEQTAAEHELEGAVYAASEVVTLAGLSPANVQQIHALKKRFQGRVRPETA